VFKKILLCTDGSDRSLTAAAVAAELALTHKANLTTLHVAQVPAVPEPFTGAPSIAEPLLEEYIRDMHRAVFARTMCVINEHGVFSEVVETVGDPVYEINKLAETIGADLIIIGSRGLTPSSALQMGSVSYGVAHGAPCPVLLVR